MTFSINHPILYVLVALIILFVLAQSVFFLRKAWTQAIALGISKNVLQKTVRSSILFTIAPAVSIVIGVITLSKKLGLPLPWLRLSVIGALTYELTAAEAAAQAVGTSVEDTVATLSAQQYVTIALVMTVGIIASIVLTPILGKKIQLGVIKMQKKDEKWGDILMTSMFMGMISAFLGLIVSGLGFVSTSSGIEFHYESQYWIPVVVMFVSSMTMMLCALCMKKFHWKWMMDYALPISMVFSMMMAIPITAWLG